MDFLLRMARALVDQVLAQLTQQLNVVEDSALSPIRAMIQAVTNGIWIGDGATAFVEEASSLVIPGITRVSDHITTMSANTQNAREVLDRADGEVDQLIKGRLFDQFNFF